MLSFQKGYTMLELLAVFYQKGYTMLELLAFFLPGGLQYVGVVSVHVLPEGFTTID